MRCLRIITGISVREKQRNIETVETMMRKRRLKWLGHVASMEPDRIPRQLLVCKLKGEKCSVGGQKLRWVDVVMRDLKKCKIKQDWKNIAQNRDEWSSIVEAAANEVNERAEEMEKLKKDMQRGKREKRGNKWKSRLT